MNKLAGVFRTIDGDSMINLDPQSLRRLQLTELELLQEADRVAKKYNISYCIIAGTMLGAVRHGGFIPWDDDVDIAMLRSEYERFREACKKELDLQKFYFQDHTVTAGYRWGYGKLRRKGSVFLREHQEHMPYEQGIFMDVFPLDPVPESQWGRNLKNLECFLVRKLLWAKVGKKADRNPFQRLLYAAMDKIPETCILQYYNGMIERSKSCRSSWVRILMFPTPNDAYGYLAKWYQGGEDILFEGKPFPGVKDPEEYLRFKFGDYMTLPPPEKRKVHPVSAFALPNTEDARNDL